MEIGVMPHCCWSNN